MSKTFCHEADMTKRHHAKLVDEGKYVAEVDVEILDTGDGWGLQQTYHVILSEAKNLLTKRLFISFRVT